MSAVLRRLVDPDEAAAELVRLANEGGGRDNITVVIVDVIDDDGRAAAIAEAQEAARQAAEAKAAAEAAAAQEAARLAALEEQENDLEPAALAGRRSSLPEADDDYGSDKDDLFSDLDRVGAKRFTWRVVAFIVALLLVAAVIVGAIGWSSRRTYHVGYRGDAVAVFKGSPEGFLWIKPTLDHETRIERDDVPVEYRDAIAAGKEFGSAQAANQWLFLLQEEIDERTDATSTTTSTSTTSTTSTTTSTTAVTPTTAATTTVPGATTPPPP